MLKDDYQQYILDERKKALKFFKLKNLQLSVYHLNEIIRMARYAYDLTMLNKAFQLRALVYIYFDDYQSALYDFKKLILVADQEENLK